MNSSVHYSCVFLLNLATRVNSSHACSLFMIKWRLRLGSNIYDSAVTEARLLRDESIPNIGLLGDALMFVGPIHLLSSPPCRGFWGLCTSLFVITWIIYKIVVWDIYESRSITNVAACELSDVNVCSFSSSSITMVPKLNLWSQPTPGLRTILTGHNMYWR